MLRTLLESARPHSIPLGSLVASVAVHVALSVPAWNGTSPERILATPESFITRALFLPPPDRVASRSASAERLQWASIGGTGTQRYFVPDGPRATVLRAAPREVLAAVLAGSDHSTRAAVAVAGNDSAYSILQVDETVTRYADSEAPLYPPDLLQQSVEGDVRVRYVVDGTGRVDTSSVDVLRSTHPRFTAAVIAALPRMRFRPATIASRPVSQVVEQDFGFRIEPRTGDTAGLPAADTTRSGTRRH